MAHDSTPHRRARSTSRSRPTTPLRPSSRSSFRDSARNSVQGDSASFPLNAFEPAFAELSDAVADLEANMMHFQLMHESLARFSESFASFLYGLNMNAFCVDFPEVGVIIEHMGIAARGRLLIRYFSPTKGPISESFKRMKLKEEEQQQSRWQPTLRARRMVIDNGYSISKASRTNCRRDRYRDYIHVWCPQLSTKSVKLIGIQDNRHVVR